MAMLAEPRRRNKWTINPRGKDWANGNFLSANLLFSQAQGFSLIDLSWPIILLILSAFQNGFCFKHIN